MNSSSDRARHSARRRVLHLALLGVAVTSFGLWLGYLWLRRDDPTTWDKDWYCFYSAGAQFLETNAADTYREQCHPNYYWLYPPYMLYPWAGLSLLQPLVVYGLVILEIMLLLGLALRWMSRALASATGDFTTVAFFIVGSAATLATLVVGQHSAILLVAVAGAMLAFARDRDVAAGLCLGLLGIKPNWAVVFVLWLVVSRRWRALGAMGAVGTAMILSTWPMGLETWEAYLTATPRAIRVLLEAEEGGMLYPSHKLITFEAFARSTLGRVSASAGQLLWIGLEILAGLTALLAWIRSRNLFDEIAVTVLVATAANVYVEFYDALLLAIPAAVWWTGRERYSALEWRLVGAAAASVWSWQWIWALSSPGPEWPSLMGAFLALWIGVEFIRALRASSDGTESSPGAV